MAATEAASADLQKAAREFRAIAKRRERPLRPEVLRLNRLAAEWAEKTNGLVQEVWSVLGENRGGGAP